MSSDSPVITLRDVHLRYRLAKQRIASLKDYAIHWVKGALVYEELWAVRGVSLEVGRGESVGIIGRNGAGKSTLLKVVSGVLKPTRGRAELRGTVAPILELGTGFDHELTGLENVYLNALLLGRTRRQIADRMEEIVAFSELGDFIRSPIRNYSSGMLARLGFSVATAWTPDVLILDEVLAVGDAHFITKCRHRLTDLRHAGTAVLVVSHDLKGVRESCQRCLWIDAGKIAAEGPTDRVVDLYEDAMEVEKAPENPVREESAERSTARV